MVSGRLGRGTLHLAETHAMCAGVARLLGSHLVNQPLGEGGTCWQGFSVSVSCFDLPPAKIKEEVPKKLSLFQAFLACPFLLSGHGYCLVMVHLDLFGSHCDAA